MNRNLWMNEIHFALFFPPATFDEGFREGGFRRGFFSARRFFLGAGGCSRSLPTVRTQNSFQGRVPKGGLAIISPAGDQFAWQFCNSPEVGGARPARAVRHT